MSNDGLYKLYGGFFVRCKPTYCPSCVHYECPTSDWQCDGICAAQEKLISNANGIGGTCKLFVEHPDAVSVDVDTIAIKTIVDNVLPCGSIKSAQVEIAYYIHQHFITLSVVPTRTSFKAWLDSAIELIKD